MALSGPRYGRKKVKNRPKNRYLTINNAGVMGNNALARATFVIYSQFASFAEVQEAWEQSGIHHLFPRPLFPVNALHLVRIREDVWPYTEVLLFFAAFFSRAASFFCLLDFGPAFCSFFWFCSLFAMR